MFAKLFFPLAIAAQCLAADNAIECCRIDARNQRAVEYVGTRSSGGKVQLGLLQQEGLKKEHRLLEIGCGALMSAIPMMSFLEEGHYVGIEPNIWLIAKTMQISENRAVVYRSKPILLPNLDFDASALGQSFDYIFAHSIMSHAAHWQLPQFLENCAKVLKKGGKVLFSIRLTEPNRYGGEGASEETQADVWQYPGCSFFHKETVIRLASKWYSRIEEKEDFTRQLTADYPTVCHDWFVLTK
jgi:cyclopropane fatty-acyl-phospholipid synthase-like methyltransferase